MTGYRLTPQADRRLDEIYDYTASLWGDDQARRYLGEIFAAFARIAARTVIWRPTPPHLNLDGYAMRSGSHIIYWREDQVAGVEIISILHQRMDQTVRLADDLS